MVYDSIYDWEFSPPYTLNNHGPFFHCSSERHRSKPRWFGEFGVLRQKIHNKTSAIRTKPWFHKKHLKNENLVFPTNIDISERIQPKKCDQNQRW